MKDPDTLYDAIRDAVEKDLKKLGLDADEVEALTDIRVEKASEVAGTWFKYSEYLTVEIDTEARTCTVVSNY